MLLLFLLLRLRLIKLELSGTTSTAAAAAAVETDTNKTAVNNATAADINDISISVSAFDDKNENSIQSEGMLQEGNVVTVRTLLKGLYEKACQQKLWGLVRHTAGMLGKRVEDLAKAITDLLVRQKQVSVICLTCQNAICQRTE